MTDKKIWIGAIIAVLAVFIASGFAIDANQDAQVAQSQQEELATQVSALSTQVAESQAMLEEYKSQLDETSEKLEDSQAEKQSLQDRVSELQKELESKSQSTNESEEQPISVEGEVIDDLFLGDTVSFTLDDGDLEKFFDGEIRFDSEDYDTHEEFSALTGDSYILYSAIDDEELGSSPAYGLINRGALEYKYVFDDPINMSQVSDKDSLKITFLGEELEIVSISASEAQFRTGESALVREGETVSLAGHEVSIEVLSSTGGYVCVDDSCKAVDEYDTELIGDVDVRLEDIIAKDNGQGIATIVVGQDTIIDQDSGDEFFNIEDSPFTLRIDSSSGYLEALAVSYDEKREDVDDDYAPLQLGDELAFPNGYVTVKFDKVLETDYTHFSFEFDDFSEDVEVVGNVDKDTCGILTSSDDQGIEAGTEDVDEVFICNDSKAYYEDTTSDWYEINLSDVKLVNDDSKMSIALSGTDLVFVNSQDSNITVATDWVKEILGVDKKDAEADDIKYNNSSIGNREYDVLTAYGTIISVPEDSADSDEFAFSIPTDKVEAELRVY